MTLLSRFEHALTGVLAWLTMSPIAEMGKHPAQRPLKGLVSYDPVPTSIDSPQPIPTDPIFRPPAGNPDDHEFQCDYSAMEGWFPCSIPENRECWLRHKDGREFNIHTNYEKFAPTGIMRNYTLYVTDGSINADGLPFPYAKLFNETYPGPWLEACWGDTLNITVVNNMKENGTSIHWHGIRQNGTMHMDGVNGITQCPIAPGDSFSYVFETTQYGTSWYHSHYSVQYADGLQGPLTIHGPSSAPFDASKKPLLMTDWSHDSAFKLLFDKTHELGQKTILLNGTGNAAHYGYKTTEKVPDNYVLHFNKGRPSDPRAPKRYLLRLINTSFDTTFIFSIDNHWLQIVTSDFVPIEPYHNTSVLIGIGQRYDVIVEADPLPSSHDGIPEDGNFWIRTYVADKCGMKPGGEGYEKTGILRYNRDSTAQPNSTAWNNIRKACSDESYKSLRPKFPWYVGEAANGKGHGEDFNVSYYNDTSYNPEFNVTYPLAAFSLGRSNDPKFMPLQINYSDPIIQKLDQQTAYDPKWVVIPEDYSDEEWVYLVLTMDDKSSFTGAHPIHLHGHDFAILQQEENNIYDPSKLNLNLDNPPRRDVVLLPNGGFVVIAFKTDNPGSWLMHCHIARHASEGLALQILERQGKANEMFPKSSAKMIENKRVCDNWKLWQDKYHAFEGDSGI